MSHQSAAGKTCGTIRADTTGYTKPLYSRKLGLLFLLAASAGGGKRGCQARCKPGALLLGLVSTIGTVPGHPAGSGPPAATPTNHRRLLASCRSWSACLQPWLVPEPVR